MAQPRVYRDGMQCPKCGSNWLPKCGRSRGKQTYRWGQCVYHFIPETEHPHQPERGRTWQSPCTLSAAASRPSAGCWAYEGWDRLFLGQKKPAWPGICCGFWVGSAGTAAGDGRKRWTLRWETVPKIHFSVSIGGCQRQRDTALKPARCTGGCQPTGMRWARAHR